MKNRSFVILSIVTLAAVVLYFGVQAYRYFTDPFSTTLAYASQSAESIPMDGWIVRSEEPLSSSAATLSHVLREGSAVGVGQTIAVAYPDPDALSVVAEIEAQELQLEQLEFAMSTYLDPDAALKLDSSITDNLLLLQGSLSTGDYSTASDQVSTLKASILKRNHTYSSNDEIQANIDSVKANLDSLRGSLSGAESITADRAGTYSAACDGYEAVLTPELLRDITPSTLDGVRAEEVDTGMGKLIYSDVWYYAANVPVQEAGQLSVGQGARLRLAKGIEQDIPVTVYAVSGEEDGRQTVVLACNRYMAQTTQLRHQQADLILATYSGIRIPSSALRLSDEGQSGVFCVVGMAAKYKPVDVVFRGDGYMLVKPTSDATGSAILRSGDEVIITANQLTDGSIINP